jgi:hypothetical protein
MFEEFSNWPEFEALRSDLESFAPQLKIEAQSLLGLEKTFKPWHEPEIYEGEWDAYGIFWAGREVERRTQAPVAKEILGSWQSVVFNAGYSLMRPGADIKPHVGYTSDVLRLHMGVLVPVEQVELVGIKVGESIKGWREGFCLLFDDTQEHCAWNKSEEARIVLLIDVLRPAGREKRRRS